MDNSMSTDVQPPSPSPDPSSPTPQSTFTQPRNKTPPICFKARSHRRQHRRSSSFGGFVSRILPSRHIERGYTLRSNFNGTALDPVGLVFGLPDPRHSNDSLADENSCGTAARKTQSWSHANTAGFQNGSNDLAEEIGASGNVEASKGVINGSKKVASSAAWRDYRKRKGTLRRLFGSMRITKGGRRSLGLSTARPFTECSMPIIEMPKYFSDEKDTTKVNQLFKDKIAQREQRRNLRESGDFLGVQGANPRTGYWDISDATTSSDPSHLGEERRGLDEQAQALSEQRRRYEEAHANHLLELARVQALRQRKKRGKAELKKAESKSRQRRHGRWRLSENGWSSVVEPDLSPIQQSLIGTPMLELPPSDRLFPMPCATNPTPYKHDRHIEEHDYFGHRAVSSPLVEAHLSKLEQPVSPRKPAISRKPVGSPSRRQRVESSSTVIHNSTVLCPLQPEPVSQRRKQQSPDGPSRVGERLQTESHTLAQEQQESFLEQQAVLQNPRDPFERRAIAISYRSASTKEVSIRPLSAQGQKVSDQEKCITCLNELPQVSVKDPVAARIPLSYPTLKGSPSKGTTLIISQTGPDRPTSFINTSTITTIGSAHLQRLLGQFDGPNDIISDAPLMDQSLQNQSSRIPLRTSSHPNNTRNEGQKIAQPVNLPDTGTLSEHHLDLTTQRSTRLCQGASPGKQRVERKSTPIFTSTSHQVVEKRKLATSRLGLRQVETFLETNQAKGQHGRGPSLSKMRKMNMGGGGYSTEARKVALVGIGGTGGPSKINRHEVASSSKSGQGAESRRYLSPSRCKADLSPCGGSLVVSHTATASAEKAWMTRNQGAGSQWGWGKTPVANTKAPTITIKDHQKAGGSPIAILNRKPPKPARAPLSIGRVLFDIAYNTWFMVEPVFDPDSNVRKRFHQQRLTWQDKSVFIAAAVFMTGAFLAMVLFARVTLQVLRTFVDMFRLLAGL